MDKNLFLATTDAEINACFDAFKALRPHIDPNDFLSQVRRQQLQSYHILALALEGRVASVAGFRFGEFLAWGRVLYIDDLSTLPEYRGRGFAGLLMDWLIDRAKAEGCHALHLDSGYARHAAHRLYLNKGLRMTSHHFALVLGDES